MNERKKRSNLEIASDVLRAARQDEVKKSHIVYKANLNFKIVREYLRTLISAGMLVSEGRYYRTTEKGLQFVQNVEGIMATIRG